MWLKRSRHPSLICEPQTDQRARPSLQVTLWQVPRCGAEAHAHMSCYMAVKPWYRAQTPVGIQPTASTHQLCRRKIQIVSSIQTGGNKPPPPVLITSSHNFLSFERQSVIIHAKRVPEHFVNNDSQPNRTTAIQCEKIKKKEKKKKNSSTTINFLSLGENKLVSCLCSEGWLFNTITIGTGMPEWKDVHGEDLLQERPLFPPLFPMVT